MDLSRPERSSERKPFNRRDDIDQRVKWHNEDSAEPWNGVDCPLCKNRGTIAIRATIDRLDYYQLQVCSCMPRRNAHKYLVQAGLEGMILEHTMESFETDFDWQGRMKQKAVDYLNRHWKVNWFYAGGQPGSGKTKLCTAITMEIINRGNEGLYVIWRDLINRVKPIMNTDGYMKMIEKYQRVAVLYIDDFFESHGQPTDADVNIASEILKYRYMNSKTTIISSEWTLDAVLKLDEAIGSRIQELCGPFVLSVAKDDSKNIRRALR